MTISLRLKRLVPDAHHASRVTLLLRHDAAANVVALGLRLEPVFVAAAAAPVEHLTLPGLRVEEELQVQCSTFSGL